MKQMAKQIKEMKENLCMRQGVYLLGGGTIITIANDDDACLEYTYSRQILM